GGGRSGGAVEIDRAPGPSAPAPAPSTRARLGVLRPPAAARRLRGGGLDPDRPVGLPDALDAPPAELICLAEAAGTLLPVVAVGAAQAKALMQGKIVSAADLGAQAPGTVAVVCEDTLVSVAEVRSGGGGRNSVV